MKIFAHLILLCTPLMSIGQTDSLSVVGEPLPEIKRSEPADLDKTISKIWELDKEDQRGTFRFLEYLPMYALPFRFTDRPTEQPISLNPTRPYTRASRLSTYGDEVPSEPQSQDYAGCFWQG